MCAPEIEPRVRGMNAGNVLRVFSHHGSVNVRSNGDDVKCSFFIPPERKSKTFSKFCYISLVVVLAFRSSLPFYPSSLSILSSPLNSYRHTLLEVICPYPSDRTLRDAADPSPYLTYTINSLRVSRE